MIYLAANNSRVWHFRREGYLMGWMFSPAGGWRKLVRDDMVMPFALDNGLYHKPTEPPKGMKALPPFYAMVRRCIAEGHSPLFVVVPDIPYDGERSRPFSLKHRAVMRWEFPGLPLAVAVQDGMTPDDLDGYDAVFVAGSTEWKWATAEMWMREAKSRGMWGHIARVNTKWRIRRCVDIGADSADGTGIWRGDRKQLGGVLEALNERLLFA